MKKILVLGLLCSFIYANESQEMKLLPLNKDALSTDNGGLLDPLKSYSDGLGIIVVGEKKYDNSIMNEFIYKYGEQADYKGCSLRKYITSYVSNSEDREKSKVLGKLALSNESNDLQQCNDNNEYTTDDRFHNRICKGIYPISCKEIKENFKDSKNGEYFIDPDTNKGKLEPFKVFCDIENGGWTKIPYKENVEFKNQWKDGDKKRFLDKDFEFDLSIEQINAIKHISKEAKQKIDFKCQNVSAYYFTKQKTYNTAIGFKFSNKQEINYKYPEYIKILKDDCSYNDNKIRNTELEINSIFLPLKNISTIDNGNENEKFGIDLLNNPAWFR